MINEAKSLSRSLDYRVRIEVAKNPLTPKEVLITLSKDEDSRVRMEVAKNPNTPIDVLIELSKGKDFYVKYGVTKNPNTPIDVLIELSKDEDINVRRSVAYNPNAPKEALITLSKDENVYVIKDVASNPNTPIEALTTLSKDKSVDVRKSVALHPNTTPDILLELSKDEYSSVRWGVALNKNTPKEALTTLSKNESYEIKTLIAKNPNTPSNTLLELSKDEYSRVRGEVALNKNTPKDVLIELSKDDDFEVRKGVAKNSNTPTEALTTLSKSASYEIKTLIAKNPNTPKEILVALTEDQKWQNYNVKKEVAKNPNTPIETLITLSKDGDNDVRRSVAQNPNTPQEVLIKLNEDNNQWVKSDVEQNPNKQEEVLNNLSENKNETITLENFKTSLENLEELINKGSLFLKDLNINTTIINQFIDNQNKYEKEKEEVVLNLVTNEKISQEDKIEVLKNYVNNLSKNNIKEILYEKNFDEIGNKSFQISIDNENKLCEVFLNGIVSFNFDIEPLKIEKPTIKNKEEAIDFIKNNTSRAEHVFQENYKDFVRIFNTNEVNPYKDLPLKFKNDIDVIIATLKIDAKPLSLDRTDYLFDEPPIYTDYTDSKSLNIFKSLDPEIKNSRELQDRIFEELLLPKISVNENISMLIKELYENRGSSIEVKANIGDKLVVEYNKTIPSYEDQMYSISSTNYENEHYYDDSRRFSEDDIIKNVEKVSEIFQREEYKNPFFNDGLKEVVQEIDTFKEEGFKKLEKDSLDKMRVLQDKIENNNKEYESVENSTTLTKEEKQDFYQTYDNIQTKLLKELEEVELTLDSLNNHKDEYDLNF